MKEEEKNLLRRAGSAVKSDRAAEQVFGENEVKANLLVAKFLITCSAGLLLCWILNACGVLAIGKQYVLLIFPVSIAATLVTALVCLYFKGRRKWLKYLAIPMLVLTFAYLDSILTFNVPLLIVLPVIFSCWYYSVSFTLGIALFSTVIFGISAFCGAWFNMDTPDMNFAMPVLQDYVRAVMLQSFLPRFLTFAIVSAVCCVIAYLGRNMVRKQDEISKKNARVETELDMAARIQQEALPEVSELPESDRRHFELAAKMMPAREVGGDFYDFFYPDPDHLALIIADVSGKGIAASLYMMMSKMMLEYRTDLSLSPGKVLEEVNNQLHEKSMNGMFVTVWLGILDLNTGDLVTANAGHEYPVICRKNGEFELFKDRHGFVLGGMDGMKYREAQLHLDEDDILFVYTDGVPEANDPAGQMFGTERMLSSLNARKDRSMTELIDGMKQDLDVFAAGAPQFDDTTMLAFRLLAPVRPDYDTVNPDQTETA